MSASAPCPSCGRDDALRVTCPSDDPTTRPPSESGYAAAVYCSAGWGGCGRYRRVPRSFATPSAAIEAAWAAFASEVATA